MLCVNCGEQENLKVLSEKVTHDIFRVLGEDGKVVTSIKHKISDEVHCTNCDSVFHEEKEVV